ncbi:MAG: ABC transporter ATP-binding protein [Dehalococcoidia bacterium]|nr:MAG: ABC transporter ATP-binding protein [Dehalococcoidia bacterium]
MLDVSNVNLLYGEFQALHDISLRVDDRELVVVFGPNGHGKSTLLKAICGLQPVASGSIIFDGKDITNFKAIDLVEMGLVYIAEDRHLFPTMSVLENLKLGAYNTKARDKEQENLEYVLQLFPRLKERLKKQAQTLSGGEARMLAIGRGLMSNARLLAVDEPSLGLAPKLRVEVFEKISEINQSGITVLMVEQNVLQASDYAAKIYLVEDGRIVFEGSKNEALNQKHVKEVFLGI